MSLLQRLQEVRGRKNGYLKRHRPVGTRIDNYNITEDGNEETLSEELHAQLHEQLEVELREAREREKNNMHQGSKITL